MRRLTYSYLLTAVVFSFVASGAYAAAAKSEPPTAADVEACWAKADGDPSKENSCLKLDLAYAQSEYRPLLSRSLRLQKRGTSRLEGVRVGISSSYLVRALIHS